MSRRNKERGETSWRLRYRIEGRRYAVTYRGSKSDAVKKLQELMHAGDTGEHVEPDKITVAEWITTWLTSAPRAARRSVSAGGHWNDTGIF
jgi:hypothetical protein